MAFHPSGRFAYVINELDSTVNVCAVGRDGALTELQSLSTLPTGFSGTNYCADIHISPDGRFVYGSNRGHDSLAIFEIDASGMLTLRGHAATGGHWPRNFALAPDSATVLVANQESEDIHVLSRNPGTGALGKPELLLKIGKPVCVLFYP
jgi:6-phosphogluconolactonase